MGQSKVFRNEVRKIMNSIEGKEFRKAYKKAGVSLDRKLFKNIHYRLTRALRRAEAVAQNRISSKGQVQKQLYKNRLIERYTRTGQTDKIKEILNPPHGK